MRGWQGLVKQKSRLFEILLQSYADKKLQAGKDKGIIKATKVWTGHKSLPRDAKADAVIDHVSKNGSTKAGAFYGNDGRKYKEIHTTNHGNPKQHPYGQHGEYAHYYEWSSDGKLISKAPKELSVKDRKENKDIL